MELVGLGPPRSLVLEEAYHLASLNFLGFAEKNMVPSSSSWWLTLFLLLLLVGDKWIWCLTQEWYICGVKMAVIGRTGLGLTVEGGGKSSQLTQRSVIPVPVKFQDFQSSSLSMAGFALSQACKKWTRSHSEDTKMLLGSFLSAVIAAKY